MALAVRLGINGERGKIAIRWHTNVAIIAFETPVRSDVKSSSVGFVANIRDLATCNGQVQLIAGTLQFLVSSETYVDRRP